MRFSTTVGTIMVFTCYATGFTLRQRAVNIDPSDCPGGKDAFAELDVEFEAARKMISYGSGQLKPDDEFAKAFFGPPRLTGSTFNTIKDRYRVMKKLATDNSGMKINVRCSKRCRRGTNAYMKIAFFKEEMVLCPPYWELQSTAELVKRCKEADISIQDVKETRARVLVHELSHSKNVAKPIIMDHLYEVPNLLLLAKGEYKKTDKKSGKKKKLDASLVTENAETYALTVGGIWTDAKCKELRADAQVHIEDHEGQAEESESEAAE